MVTSVPTGRSNHARGHPSPLREIIFYDFRLDALGQALRHRARRVRLSQREIWLLIMLVRAAPRTLTRDEIAAGLWGNLEFSDSALSQTIYRLRRKLALHEPRHECINTVEGVGFQFVAPIKKSDTHPDYAEFLTDEFLNYRRAAFLAQQRRPDELRRAIALLERCAEEEDKRAAVLTALARIYIVTAEWGLVDTEHAYRRARQLASLAYDLEPFGSEALAVQSRILLSVDADINAAAIAAEEAVLRLPGSLNALSAAVGVSIVRGYSWEVPALLRGAIFANPCSAELTTLLGMSLYFGEHYQEAHEHFTAALEFDPAYAPAAYFDACSLTMLESFNAAEARVLQVAFENAPKVLALRAYIAGRRGDAALFDRILNDLDYAKGTCNVFKAIAFAGAVRPAEAEHHLAMAIAEREPDIAYLPVEPLAKGLSGNSRIGALLQSNRMRAADR